MLGSHQSRYKTLADSPSKIAEAETTNTNTNINKHTKGASCGDATKPKSRKEKRRIACWHLKKVLAITAVASRASRGLDFPGAGVSGTSSEAAGGGVSGTSSLAAIDVPCGGSGMDSSQQRL